VAEVQRWYCFPPRLAALGRRSSTSRVLDAEFRRAGTRSARTSHPVRYGSGAVGFAIVPLSRIDLSPSGTDPALSCFWTSSLLTGCPPKPESAGRPIHTGHGLAGPAADPR
jgi:hypothetical protein